MKTIATIMQRAALAAALTTTVALTGMPLGCSTTQAMRSGANVPASEGTVRATEGDNGNTNLSIKVEHLALPSRVASDATVYIVWIQPPNAGKHSVGALTVNDDLEGTLEAVTSYSEFLVMVTPEPNGQVAEPTHDPVFTSDVKRED